MDTRCGQKNRAGFTLVEIAIVLVIIGLLIGGVLKGQAMVENAKVKRVVKQADELRAAVRERPDPRGLAQHGGPVEERRGRPPSARRLVPQPAAPEFPAGRRRAAGASRLCAGAVGNGASLAGTGTEAAPGLGRIQKMLRKRREFS